MSTETDIYGFAKLNQIPTGMQPWADNGMHLVICQPTEFGEYALVGCEPTNRELQHQIRVLDEKGNPLPNIQVVVAFPDGDPIGKPTGTSYWAHGETDLRGKNHWTDGNGYAYHYTGALGGERIWIWDIDPTGDLKLACVKVENCAVVDNPQYHNRGVYLTFQRRMIVNQPAEPPAHNPPQKQGGSMSELLRFRLARAPQKRAVDPDVTIPFDGNAGPQDGLKVIATDTFELFIQDIVKNPGSYAVGFQSNGFTLLPKPAPLAMPVDKLEKWLTSVGNRPTGVQLSAELFQLNEPHPAGAQLLDPQDLKGNADYLINRAAWKTERNNILASMTAALLQDSEPTRAVYFHRLMQVIGLVELAAANPDRLKTADDVYWALRSRNIILPQQVVDQLRSKRPVSFLARRPGFSDLYIVRSEWADYQAGEIAHIENVMASETRERNLTNTTETELTTTTTEQRTSFNEQDSQTTDRFNLHTETSRDSELNIKVDGSVDASGQYGTTKVNTHLGGSLDYSLNESQKKASDVAHESVSRAVTRVEEQVTQTRTMRTLTRSVEENKHSFKNDAQDAAHISGIYRWVNKIERIQVFRYPNRFLLEYQVPEPGAWLRWKLQNRETQTISENPAPLTIDGTKEGRLLTPKDFNTGNYLEIGARYKTVGVKPPPKTLLVSAVYNQDTTNPRDPNEIKKNDSVRFIKLADIAIPPSYIAKKWYAKFAAWGEASYNGPGDQASIVVMVGFSQWYKEAIDANSAFTVKTDQAIEVDDNDGIIIVDQDTNPGIEQAALPVSIRLNNIRGFDLHIIVECDPSETSMMQWSIDTYEKTSEAYYAMKRQYDDELTALSIRKGVEIQGLSPEQNAEMARTEMKKAIVEMLTATSYKDQFSGRNAITRRDDKGKTIPPQVDLKNAVEKSPEVQFIEQAFEWENMTYVLYPYFWTGNDQWDDLFDLSGTDPDFARFLRAGSVRVVLPARPGFEDAVWAYVNLGILWSGGSAPAPGEDEYLSIAEEIRAQEKAPRDGIPGESWEVTLPTTLVWLDTKNNGLPVDNPNKQLDAPPGRVLP